MIQPFLLPCPFCGKQPEYSARCEAPHHNNYWPEHVKCRDCRITFRTGEKGCAGAVEMWNRRPVQVEMAKPVLGEDLLHILRHAIGADNGVERSHYCCYPGSPSFDKCKELVALGFMIGPYTNGSDMHTFNATDTGRSAAL